MKIFKQKRLRRVLSLAFAFTLVFTLAMSTSAAVANAEGHKYRFVIEEYEDGNYLGDGDLDVFVPDWLNPYEIIRAEASLGAYQIEEDGDSDSEPFTLRMQLNSFDDYTWVNEGVVCRDGMSYGQRIEHTYELSPSEVIVEVRAEYYVYNEAQDNYINLPSITTYGTEAVNRVN